METEEYLSVLNNAQKAAVVHEGSSLLILAGAGSGKTRVITTKIAYLIQEKKINPYYKDIRDRLQDYFGTKVNINSNKNKGKIEIEYYSEEDLQRILDIINLE